MLGLMTSVSVVEVAIAVVVLAAICGLVFVALKQFQIPVPTWVQHALWIVVVAAVIIFLIKVVAGFV